jgi:tRNA threonylcarbamoyladenosine biosynthesis protein TsaE
MEIHSDSPEATARVAEALARVVDPGAVIALEGDLGAGKTTFVQGFAAEMKAPEPVSSPTFVLLRVYQGRLPLYHFDAYRLDGPRELDDFGADEYFWGDGVSLVEWGERVAEALPADRIEVRIEHESASGRRLVIEATGPRHAAMLARLEV